MVTAILAVMLMGCVSVHTAPTPQVRQALAPTGKLRVGLSLASATSVLRDPASGEMKGVAFDLGKELARRLGVPFEPVVYRSIVELVSHAKSGQWDVAFFAVDPAREKDVDFTAPHLELEHGYLVPAGSIIFTSAHVDRQGVRVAVREKAQADSILSRELKHAVLIRSRDIPTGLEMVKSGEADILAAIKAILFEISDQLPGSRVLDGRFATEQQAMAIPKGRDLGMPYARKFVEDAKFEGLVKAAIESVGLRGAVVAPLQ